MKQITKAEAWQNLAEYVVERTENGDLEIFLCNAIAFQCPGLGRWKSAMKARIDRDLAGQYVAYTTNLTAAPPTREQLAAEAAENNEARVLACLMFAEEAAE